MIITTKRPPARAALIVGGAAVLLLLAACAPVAGDSDNGEYVLVPSSTNRPSGGPSATPAPSTGPGGIAAEDAPLAQLWALANSEVGDEPSALAGGPGVGLADFSAAIATRCYPQLADAEKTELDGLKAAYESLAGADAADPAHAYFVRATELCM